MSLLKKPFVLFFLIYIYIFPFEIINIDDNFYLFILKSIVALLVFLYYIFFKKKFSKIIVLIIFYQFTLLVSTIINEGNLFNCFKDFILILTFCMFVELAVLIDFEKFLNSCVKFFTLMFFVYLLVILVQHDLDKIQNILGHRNQLVMVFLPCIYFSVLKSHFEKEKINIKVVLLSFGSFAITIFTWSATSLVGLFMIVIYILFIYKNQYKYEKIFNYRNYMIIVFAFFFLIIIMRVQDLFSFVIEDILGKSLTFTGRTFIWDRTLEYIKLKPLLGNGIEHAYLYWYKIQQPHTHNTFLEIMYSGGMITFTFFVSLLVVAGKKISYHKNMFSYVLAFVIFIYLIMFQLEVYAVVWLFYGTLVMSYNLDEIVKQHERYKSLTK